MSDPYCWDQRWDNLASYDVTFTLSYENGLPKWAYSHHGKSYPTASYNNSYFYCDKNDTLRIRGSQTASGSGERHDLSVIGFFGWLTSLDFSMPYIEEAMNFGGLNFTTDKGYPYVSCLVQGLQRRRDQAGHN